METLISSTQINIFVGIGVIMFYLIFYGFIKIRQKKNSGIHCESVNEMDKARLNKILPIVRVNESYSLLPFRKRKVLAVFDDVIFLFRVSNKFQLDLLYDPNFTQSDLKTKGVFGLTKIPIDSITKVSVEKTTKLGNTYIQITSNLGKSSIKKTLNFPEYELPNLLSFLNLKLKKRIKKDCPIGFHNPLRLLFTLVPLLFLMITAIAAEMEIFDSVPLLFVATIIFAVLFTIWIINHFPRQENRSNLNSSLFKKTVKGLLRIVLISIIGIFVFFSLFGVFIDFYNGNLSDQIAIAINILVLLGVWWLYKNERKAANNLSDKSKSKPFRSKFLAILLKIVVAGFMLKWAYPFIVGPFLYKDGIEIIFELIALPYNLIVASPYMALIAAPLLLLAHALYQKELNEKSRQASANAILFLRSFNDDRETTLNPQTAWSAWAGIDYPYDILQRNGLSSGPLFRFGQLLIRYFLTLHPLRLFRLFIGRPNDTTEHQLANVVSEYGSFIAIGKPSEKIVTTGADRMYVSNSHWKNVVMNMLDDANQVILQPSSSQGIWWEIEKVIETVDPSKLLFCLVGYRGAQNSYENFRTRMEELLPNVKFPRGIGTSQTVSFVHFNSNWEIKRIKVKYLPFKDWILRGKALDLGNDLEPFLNKSI